MERPVFIEKSGIYTITSHDSGKIYVGSAVYLRGRYAHHVRRLNLEKHRNRHLQNAWNKYGADNFEFAVLLYCDKENLIYYEQRAIDAMLCAYGRDNLYNLNLVAGSVLGRKHSAETKAKIGAGRRGKRHSAETKAKMSRDRKGRRPTEEARARAVATRRGYVHSEETRAKISKGLARYWIQRRAQEAACE